MKILLLGSGGREHALAWKISQSKRCSQLFIAPGNAGTAPLGKNISLSVTDFQAIRQLVLDEGIGLVVVGPEEPLVRGIWDFFQHDAELARVPLLAPSQAGAMLEGSKAWAKQFMARHGIPTASYREFTAAQLEAAQAYLLEHPLPVVLKADGLAAGKGVVICQSHAEAVLELKAMLAGKFGDASRRVVVEAYLQGIEFSVFVLTDGKHYKILPEAKDYKRIGEGDTGSNTGGMGAVSPVPFLHEKIWQKVENQIIIPTVHGLRKEKIIYRGFIFFGLILVGEEPFVIEYNCRMGDPETEVVMPRLKNDLVKWMLSAARGKLTREKTRIDRRAAATVFLVSGGYPGNYQKGKKIENLDKTGASLVFHAGTKMVENHIVTDGGRVLALTNFGKNIDAALKKSNRAARAVHFEGKYFRRDIGEDVLKWTEQ